MKLTGDKLKLIGESINKQFLNLKKDGTEVNVTLFKSNNFKISSSIDAYTMRLVGITETGINTWPAWIDVETTSDVCITIPHSRTAELEFLLRKSFEDFTSDPTQPPEDSLISQLQIQVHVWNMGGEIMDKDSQRGLIGEIVAIAEATKQVGNDNAILGWDETSSALVDITHGKDWGIEAKSKSPSSNSVKVSSRDQLTRKDPLLALAVTDVSADKKHGKTLPEIAEDILDDLKHSQPTANVSELRKKIDAFHRVFSMKDYFVSKWDYGSTDFFEINVDSVPDKFGNSIPAGVTISGYKLDLDVLSDPKKLKDIIHRA